MMFLLWMCAKAAATSGSQNLKGLSVKQVRASPSESERVRASPSESERVRVSSEFPPAGRRTLTAHLRTFVHAANE